MTNKEGDVMEASIIGVSMLEHVQARIEVLSGRLHRPEPKKPPKSHTGRCDIAVARKAQQRKRRERLETERESWALLAGLYHGNVKKIACRMGCDWYTAHRALWDLGLWPAVVRAREAAKATKCTRMAQHTSGVHQCHGGPGTGHSRGGPAHPYPQDGLE